MKQVWRLDAAEFVLQLLVIGSNRSPIFEVNKTEREMIMTSLNTPLFKWPSPSRIASGGRKSIGVRFMLAFVAALLIFSLFSTRRFSARIVPSAGASSIDKWEYTTVYGGSDSDVTRQLNQLGESGWELSGIAYREKSSNVFWLKRKVQ